ncbi:Ran GTPase binding protein Sbp1 [Leucoagaricus gongylophorus]
MSETPDALAPREPSDTHASTIGILEKVEVRTYEEDEDVRFKKRAKLFRFDNKSTEWKERGTGDVKILQNRETGRCRVLMRREQTLKVATNFSISPDMKLQPNIGSDRSWVCKVHADYADESAPVSITLAIRFANANDADQFKAVFEDARTKNAALSSVVKDRKENEEGVSGEATEEVKEGEDAKKDGVEKEEEVKKEDEVKEGDTEGDTA